MSESDSRKLVKAAARAERKDRRALLSSADRTVEVGAWCLLPTIVLPPVGIVVFVLGAIAAVKGRPGAGAGLMCGALAVAALSLVLWSALLSVG